MTGNYTVESYRYPSGATIMSIDGPSGTLLAFVGEGGRHTTVTVIDRHCGTIYEGRTPLAAIAAALGYPRREAQ